MLSRLLGWLGLERKRPPPQTRRPAAARPRSATAHLFEKRPPAADGKSPAGRAAAENDFNPYNTGKFDRSASWERISKNQR
jgi:hypothetical protein